jgi:hypothetical protein
MTKNKSHTRRCAERLLLARADRPLQSKKKKPTGILALIHRYAIHLTASLHLEWDERTLRVFQHAVLSTGGEYLNRTSRMDERGSWLGEGQLRCRDGHAYAWLRTRERSFAPHSDTARRLPPGHRRRGLLLVLATLPAFLRVPRVRRVL